jgi:hypothetical protein
MADGVCIDTARSTLTVAMQGLSDSQRKGPSGDHQGCVGKIQIGIDISSYNVATSTMDFG